MTGGDGIKDLMMMSIKLVWIPVKMYQSRG